MELELEASIWTLSIFVSRKPAKRLLALQLQLFSFGIMVSLVIESDTAGDKVVPKQFRNEWFLLSSSCQRDYTSNGFWTFVKHVPHLWWLESELQIGSGNLSVLPVLIFNKILVKWSIFTTSASVSTEYSKFFAYDLQLFFLRFLAACLKAKIISFLMDSILTNCQEVVKMYAFFTFEFVPTRWALSIKQEQNH